MGLEFLAAVYNEENEIDDLIHHVSPYVDGLNFWDDGSRDSTVSIIWKHMKNAKPVRLKGFAHTGLPETVKNAALSLVPDGSWVLMLDADERFAPGVLEAVREWVDPINIRQDPITHIYFRQIEIIDGVAVREFQKAKLFRKEAVMFPLNNIHADDQFRGDGLYKEDWIVYHRKTTSKQIQRETEYLETYRKLREEGHIDEGREQWLRNLHHFKKS